MSDPNEELLTAEEAAERLGVTRSYLYRMIKRGLVPEALGIRNGREVKLIPASALSRLDAAEGLLVRDVRAGEARPVTDPSLAASSPTPPTPPERIRSHSSDTDLELTLIAELRTELRLLREQLAQERAARQELEARVKQPPTPPEDLISVIGRANEVTALVKASEIKQHRILEELLAQRRWGRAKQVAYGAYLAVTTLVGIGALVLIYRIAHQFEVLLNP